MTMDYGLTPAEQAGRRAQQRGELRSSLRSSLPPPATWAEGFAEYARRAQTRPSMIDESAFTNSPDIRQRNLGRMFTPSGQLPLPTITSDTADQLARQGQLNRANQLARLNPDRYRTLTSPSDIGFRGAGTTADFINRQSGIFPQVTQYINPGGRLTSANTDMTGLRPPPTPTPVTSGPMPWASQPSNVMPTVTYPLTPGEQSAALQQRRGQARLRGMRENFLRFPDAFYNPPQGLNPTRMSGMLPGPLPNTGNWNTDLQTVINQPWNNRGF